MKDTIKLMSMEESLINDSSELKRIEPLRSLFLDCWSNAHDSPDYDKRKWQDLASELRKFGLEVQ